MACSLIHAIHSQIFHPLSTCEWTQTNKTNDLPKPNTLPQGYYNDITHALSMYERVVAMVTPATRALLAPHLRDLERTISPAYRSMTWTSMNIEPFLANLKQAITRFQHLVTTINDITVNRIQKNLDYIANLCVVYLPSGATFQARDFLAEQKKRIESTFVLLPPPGLLLVVCVRLLFPVYTFVFSP